MIHCLIYIQEGSISFSSHIYLKFPRVLTIFLVSDITALAKDKAYAWISLDEISIHQVITT